MNGNASEQPGTTAAGKAKPRLEDRIAQAVKAFEGLEGAEIIDLFKRLWREVVGPDFPTSAEIRTQVEAFFSDLRTAVKGDREDEKPFVSRLNELCAKRKYGAPSYLERLSDNETEYVVVVTVTYLEASDISKPHSLAYGKSRSEAKEAAAKKLFQKLTK